MLKSGTILQGRYRVVRLIAEGGFGAVYEAFDARLHQPIALKHLLRSAERITRQVELEAQLLATVRHSALPPVIDYLREGAELFLVVEYIPGDDMEAMLVQHGVA